MRIRAIILILFLAAANANSQQLPVYSQYLYNKFLLNPSVAGSDGYTSFALTAREQWVGYKGAPRTVSFSWQTRMLKRSYILRQTSVKKQVYRPKSDGKVGLGGYIFSDNNGLINRTGFQFSYAYHTWLKKETQLSFGLSVNGYHYKIDEEQVDFEDPSDPLLNSSLRRGLFVPDATFGVYLLNANYSFGFSADQLFQASGKIGGSQAYQNFSLKRQYYLFGSYDISHGPYNIIQPSFLLTSSEQWTPMADIGVTYIFHDDFWAGLAYRTSKAIIATVGVKYQNIYLGYAFDFTMQEIQRVTYGTHEINFALKFGDNKRKYRWLDRY
ncbi:MAG TPA: type IX secretion system membrane protein PorP/SprF [Bacteroidales bacterium]|nr:type IX secretion system membrane protein PorP/SprF [Bacteroidales bacterium]